MTLLRKNLLYVVILLVGLGVFSYFGKRPPLESLTVKGFTMGTTWQVIYFDRDKRDFKKEIDSLLLLVNRSINTYDSTSEVSQFNRGNGFQFKLPHFCPPLKKGEEVYHESEGAFDLTVMPLVNAWGFGPGKTLTMDSSTVDSLRSIVGFEKLTITKSSVSKSNPRVQLDFGGIGQGYGADVIADFLSAKGVSDFLIELGGEGLVRGTKNGERWTIAILDANSTRDNQFYKGYVRLKDRSYTTSGNYFNYRMIDDKKFSHTIDPKTGYPVTQTLLSASVFADDAMTADAWATAFMVMGEKKAKQLLEKHPELDAILQYTIEDGSIELFITDNIKGDVILEDELK